LQVVGAGLLGARLFSRALDEVSATRTQRCVDRHVQKLFQGLVSLQLIKDTLAAVAAEVQRVSPKALDPYASGRTASFVYLGVPLTIQVRSLLDSVELAIWCRIKTDSVRARTLEEVWHELALQTTSDAATSSSVEPAVLEDCASVRTLARKYGSERAVLGVHEIQEILREHGAYLLARDRRWRLEAGFFAERVVAGGAEAEMKRRVLTVLRCNPVASKMVDARQAMHTLTVSPLFGFVGAGVQALTQQILDTVAAIEDRRAHARPKAAEGFYDEARTLMVPWLQGLLPPGVQADAPENAAPALAAWLQTVDKKAPEAAVGARLALSFGWLLSEPGRRAALAVLDAAASSAAAARPAPADAAGTRPRPKGAAGRPSSVGALFAKRR
jgi:hypothetical protein